MDRVNQKLHIGWEMAEPLEIVPIVPFVADSISIRRCPGGCFCIVFAFDDGEGPRITAKGFVTPTMVDHVRTAAEVALHQLQETVRLAH